MKEAALGWAERGGYPRPKSLVQVPDGPGARRSTGYPLSEALERRPKPRLKLRAKLRAKLRP